MSLFSRMRPSPAMVVACVALSFALAGSAVGGVEAVISKLDKKEKQQVKRIAKRQANKVLTQRQASLNVNNAKTADNATNASNAQNAANLGGSPPSAFAPSEAEPYHEVGSAGEPDFGAGWSNEDPVGQTSAAFYKDPWDVVHLKGIVLRAGGSPTIFTLPADYRPTKAACFPSVRTDTPGGELAYVCVQANGNVEELGTDSDGVYLLDGLTFRAGTG